MQRDVHNCFKTLSLLYHKERFNTNHTKNIFTIQSIVTIYPKTIQINAFAFCVKLHGTSILINTPLIYQYVFSF